MSSTWVFIDPRMTVDHLGFLPSFLDENDPDSAVVQINKNYQHGGGWLSIPGFEMKHGYRLKYPGDPELLPLAVTTLHDKEKIFFYDSAIVCVVQEDGSWDVSRID